MINKKSPLLSVQDLHYTIEKKEILKGISFSLEKGHIMGIIGPNGCGKSTLLSHISRRIPSKNCIYYDGKPIEDFSRLEYAREVAVMVQQGNGLSDELLAKDVVLMGRYPYKSLLSGYSKKDHEIARHAMEQVGAHSLADKPMGSMSGGEKQRVRIAKAFAQEPELLLLDEPTNHLDAKHKLSLMQYLASYRKKGTTLVVLHDLSLAARYCDDILVMKSGQIIKKGPAKEILVPEILESIFEVPFYRAEHDGKLYLYY